MIELTSQNEALLQRLSEVEKESGESKPIKPTEHQDPQIVSQLKSENRALKAETQILSQQLSDAKLKLK
jgi:hypothetical protein